MGRLVRARIAAAVAREAVVADVQFREDLADELERLLVGKVLGGGEGGYDLERARTASATGWARQFLRAARRSAARNVHARGLAKAIPVDPTQAGPEEGGAPGVARACFHRAAAPETGWAADAVPMDEALDWFTARSRHLRDASRLAAQAAGLRHAYGLPEPVRPRPGERRRLAALVADAPQLARDSAEAMHAIVAGEHTAGQRPTAARACDDGLLALWDSFSRADMEALLEAPGLVGLTLVRAAVADRPKPDRSTTASFRAAVRAEGTGRGWTRAADALSAVFLALEFESSSAFDTTSEHYRRDRAEERADLCAKAPAAFDTVLAHPGQRLGRTHEEVYDRLAELAAEVAGPCVAPAGIPAAARWTGAAGTRSAGTGSARTRAAGARAAGAHASMAGVA
ncbi:hypothetical protein GCM10028789_08050 [Sinomonas halotolerans]